MKRLLLILAFAACAYTSQAQDGALKKTYSLKECVDIALQNNLTVKKASLDAQRNSLNLAQAKSNRLPDLFSDLTHGLNQGRSIDPFTNTYVNQQIFYGNYSLGTNVILYNGNQLQNLVRQSKLEAQAGRMDVQQAEDDLMLNVLLAYLQLLNNQEQLQQSRNQLMITQQQADRLTGMNKEGAIMPATLYDVKGQFANDQLQVINSRNAVETAKLDLARLMNMPYDSLMQVVQITADDLTERSLPDAGKIYTAAVNRLGVTKAAAYRLQSAQKGIAIARAAFAPVISLGAGLFTNYSNVARRDILLGSNEVPSGDFVNVGGAAVPVITTHNNVVSERINYKDQFTNNYNTSVAVNVRIPIFNGNRARNNLSLAKIDLQEAGVTDQNLRTRLRQSIDEAIFNLSAAYEKYTVLKQQVKDFNESYRIAEVRFKEGVSNQVDYLVAKNNADRASVNLIIAKYDYVFRLKIVEYYEGTPELGSKK